MSLAVLTPVEVCRLDDLPLGLGRAFAVGGHRLAVFRDRSGEVYAVAADCPHKAGPLADGMLVNGRVVCPLHAARFDGRTGECDQPELCGGVAAYPAEVRDGAVYVTVPAA